MKVSLNAIGVFIKIVLLIIIMGGGGHLEDRVIHPTLTFLFYKSDGADEKKG
ncbi:hypothetical protein HpBGD34_14950 [Helicobacter pylori]